MPAAIAWIGSRNRTQGRQGLRPEAIVIHIMEGTLAGTDAWFGNPASKVSAHYGIGTGGAVHQYVSEGDTAYHAGRTFKPAWKLPVVDAIRTLVADSDWWTGGRRASLQGLTLIG